MTKIRPVGDIIGDLEHLLDELYVGHDMQHGDVLALILGFSKSHYPHAEEEYVDGTSPVWYYGHIDGLNKKRRRHGRKNAKSS